MSFLDKMKFWKKHDDFSFEQDTTPSEDYSGSSGKVQTYLDSTGSSDQFGMQEGESGLPPDPLAAQGSTEDPLAFEHTQSRPTQGQQLAHDYMQSQQQTMQPPQQMQKQQRESQDQKLEMLSLKMDSIKSELDALNQHIKKLEVMIERSGAKRW